MQCAVLQYRQRIVSAANTNESHDDMMSHIQTEVHTSSKEKVLQSKVPWKYARQKTENRERESRQAISGLCGKRSSLAMYPPSTIPAAPSHLSGM